MNTLENSSSGISEELMVCVSAMKGSVIISARSRCNLLTIQVGEHGEIITEDTVQALELIEESVPTQTDCYLLLSAHAEAGSEGADTMQFRTLVGNQV
jgi:hypothetical protein